ncbi:ABC-type transport auxiliary lipoprotein family protein [Sneathiella sp. HT1-7]|jgi:cholesterol transport system auxiliary component|uniref:ABC-type transport auxiliary lipoprotein family protein n=1 Tax=Sneathiella sp. HT1-7 TaxID=2887192 RepID=UPI001D13A6E8|nr:ABC-type transport auxiliary lipoprotein family protein [Sneathiella sp. HT1-7]MCC3304325.1 ABC-type transport auxiliary lipoprotein family protein [Sneathiella sp. HT1-7]
MMKPKYSISIIVATLLIVLAGCGTISISGEKGVVNLYNLTPKSTFSNNLPHVNWKLVIEEPIATGGLNSKRIALHPKPTELKYFADASWTERTPLMIQTLLIESFTNSGHIATVGRDAISLQPNYILKGELREFQAEYFHGTAEPLVRVRLNAILFDPSRQEIVASDSFEAAVLSTATNMDAIILAFDIAMGKVLRRTVEWTLATP